MSMLVINLTLILIILLILCINQGDCGKVSTSKSTKGNAKQQKLLKPSQSSVNIQERKKRKSSNSGKKTAILILTCRAESSSFKWIHDLDEALFSVIFLEECYKKQEFLRISPGKFLLRIHRDNLPNTGSNLTWVKIMLFIVDILNEDNIDFLWLIEDDVFLPNVNAFLVVHQKTLGVQADFASGGQFKIYLSSNQTSPSKNRMKNLPMTMGMSANFVKELKQQIIQRNLLQSNSSGSLFWGDLVHHVSKDKNYAEFRPPELSTLHSNHYWTCEKILQIGFDKWYHPIEYQASFVQYCIATRRWQLALVDSYL